MREVLPLAIAPDAAALQRAEAALKSVATTERGAWCWSMVYWRRRYQI